jgi:hypothetical protein
MCSIIGIEVRLAALGCCAMGNADVTVQLLTEPLTSIAPVQGVRGCRSRRKSFKQLDTRLATARYWLVLDAPHTAMSRQSVPFTHSCVKGEPQVYSIALQTTVPVYGGNTFILPSVRPNEGLVVL